jgi:hypothetical protein
MTTPNDPGGLYVLNWEQYACGPQATPPQGWNEDYPDPVSHPNGEPAYRVACAPDPVRAGARSARFQLNKGDPISSGGARAELKAPCCEPDAAPRWYGFSIYLPGTGP